MISADAARARRQQGSPRLIVAARQDLFEFSAARFCAGQHARHAGHGDDTVGRTGGRTGNLTGGRTGSRWAHRRRTVGLAGRQAPPAASWPARAW